MKRSNSLVLILAALIFTVACNKVSYKKTSSGLMYKIFPGNSKDSLVKNGNVVKFHVVMKLNDSVMYSSYDKAPAFLQITPLETPTYNLMEILTMMKNGDSAITVQMVDTLLKKNAQLPPNAKKGDRMTTQFRIIEVFREDSLAMVDYQKEMEKDRPRQMKEQEEQRAKYEKEAKEQQIAQDAQLEKSGEMARQMKEVEDYLANKKINAEKTGKGTYVEIKHQGSGRAAENGKFLTVKYAGRLLANDSVFETSQYAFPLGKSAVIRGWDEGLLKFKEGTRGTIYVPGFLAYANSQTSPFKPYAAMIFDVELLKVTDTLPQQGPPMPPGQK